MLVALTVTFIVAYMAARGLFWRPPQRPGDRVEVLRDVLAALVATAVGGVLNLISVGIVAPASGLMGPGGNLAVVYMLALLVGFYVGVLLLLVLSVIPPLQEGAAIVSPAAVKVATLTVMAFVTACSMFNIAAIMFS